MRSMSNLDLPSVTLRATLCLLLGSSGELLPQTPPAHVPQSYVRIGRPDTNTVQLEIAMRRFVPRSGEGGSIWLVAAAHIGETNYYRGLQTFLEEQALVLFEGVGGEEDFKERSRRLRQQPKTDPEASTGDIASLQSTLAESLGMAFQLDAIDYDRDHFQNSDLSMDELQRLLMREIESSSEEGSGGTANPAFVTLMGAMDGSSWLGTVLHMGVRLLGTSSKLKAMSRLFLIEMLGRLEGDLTQMQGLPPDFQELMNALIRERNKKVLRDTSRALQRPGPARSIAIFYGAGHMADLEKRLDQDLNYRPSETRWMPAIVVRPAQSGLSEAEVNMVRSMVDWQLEALKQQLQQADSKPAGAKP